MFSRPSPQILDEFVQEANQELDAYQKARRVKLFAGKLKRGCADLRP